MHADVLTGAVEGPVDEIVLRRVVEQCGRTMGTVYVAEGKQNLLRRLSGFNDAARFAPWVVLVDLNGLECAPVLRKEALSAPAPLMRFRVAVRAIESWLLADRERMADFVGVSLSRVPHEPDDELDPKRSLVDVARHSRRRAIREDMVPDGGSGRRVGRAYEARWIEFVLRDGGWRPAVAAEQSESLRRCIDSLR